MIDRLKQIWGEASWGYRILILLFLPLVIVLVLMSLRKGSPDHSLETAQESAKIEESRQAKEEQAVREYKSTTRGFEREHMKRRQEIERIQTSEEMRRALDEELRR